MIKYIIMDITEVKDEFVKKSKDNLLKMRETLDDNETKMKISCGVISRICFVLEILCFVIAAYGFITMFLLLFPGASELVRFTSAISSFTMTIFLPLNYWIHDIGVYISETQMILLSHLSFGVVFIILGVGLHSIMSIFLLISKNSKPFDAVVIKKLRNLSLFSLVCGIIQPIFLLFSLLFFAITYIFKYGSVIQQKSDNLINDQERIIFALAEMSENKSGQTGQHIKRVSEYAKVLAEGLNLSRAKVEEIRLASVWHDIGKLLIDSAILEKPGRLTDEEFAVMKKHVVYGDELLEGLEGSVFETARLIARDHHERIDGKGYANALSGDAVSLEGRIVAVADVFDALTSRRSYKEAWDITDAYNEIVKNSGTQFDGKVVEVFKAKFEEIKAIAEKYR